MRIVGISLSIVGCLCLLARMAPGQDAKKPPPTEISGDVGFVLVGGNTSTSTLSVNERYIRRIDTWAFKEDFGEIYGKTDGIESSNLLRAVSGPTTMSRAISRSMDSRTSIAEGAGGVWKILATDVDQFNLETGYQYTEQENLIGPDHDFSALRVASSWKHSFTKEAYVFQSVEYIPDLQDSNDYRVNTETDLVAPLSAHTAMKFSYVVRFANAPPPNAAGTALLQKTDQILSAGIQVTY
jgi:putative salt-induced outer membrane protein